MIERYVLEMWTKSVVIKGSSAAEKKPTILLLRFRVVHIY